jgi:flagellar biosynthesis protein FlhB
VTLYNDNSSERTEMPTTLRLAEARRRGIVARSGEMTSSVALLAAVAVLAVAAGPLGRELLEMTRSMLGATNASIPDGPEVLAALGPVAKLTAAVLAVLAAAAALAGFVQVGPLATAEPTKADFSRVSPLAGAGRLFGGRGAFRAGLTLAKAGAVAGIAVLMAAAAWDRVSLLPWIDLRELAPSAGDTAVAVCLRVGAALLVLAAADLLYQRWQHRQDLKMTRRELRQDMRQLEGDPAVRRARRQFGSAAARHNVAVEVPRAEVVIVCADGPAAAVRHDTRHDAPQVLAAGNGWLARRIEDIATAAGVPVVQHDELARTLARACRAGSYAPPATYSQIAEIIAYARRVSTDAPQEIPNAGAANG